MWKKKIPDVELVYKASLQKIGRFTKQGISELCPSLRVSFVEVALRKMVTNDELVRKGKGKSTCHYRTR